MVCVCVLHYFISLIQSYIFPFSSYPCCSLALHDNMIVAGFGSGHLRVYHQQTGCLLCEADAHSRAVTSIDVATGSGSVLSGSEDTFIRVWQLLGSGEV